jgi:Protein of unknown function (DUF2800)
MNPIREAVAHALFSPSASPRWIPCPGSMAFKENQEQGESSTYADAGTAMHTLSAWALQAKDQCANWPMDGIVVNGTKYPVTEEVAEFAQVYVDDVRNRAVGGSFLVEQRVDLSEWIGAEQFGTSDAIIVLPKKRNVTIEDLKGGSGVKVYAWMFADADSKFTVNIRDEFGNWMSVEPNFQLMLYALGSIPLAQMLMDDIETVTIVICQPPLDHIHELTISLDYLMRFGEFVSNAVGEARKAMELAPGSPDLAFYLNPGDKQCRWCRAKAGCPKLTAFVADQVRMDFEDIPEAPPLVNGLEALSKAMMAVPLIQQWCGAVSAEVWRRVLAGDKIMGPDGQPYKFVQDKDGNRKWADEAAAEEVLVGQLGEKAYAPKKIITAPAAGKILDKKKTAALWNDVFVPLIKRAPGKPTLALGSDPRPVFTGTADASEFDEAPDNGE